MKNAFDRYQHRVPPAPVVEVVRFGGHELRLVAAELPDGVLFQWGNVLVLADGRVVAVQLPS